MLIQKASKRKMMLFSAAKLNIKVTNMPYAMPEQPGKKQRIFAILLTVIL